MIHYIYNYFLTRQPTKKSDKWVHWQIYKYLRAQLIRYYKNKSKNSLGIDDQSNLIVSMTSFPARIDVVYLSIKSMLNQTQRPKKIVLWLGEAQFPNGEAGLPHSLLALRSLGLDIEFCEDLKAHKKYFFAFQKYPDNLIVTVDDDVIYPKDLLAVLMETHLKYPNSVVANRVRFMEQDAIGFKPYRGWKINDVGTINPSKKIFSTGVGGVLYQPNLFSEVMFDIDGIKKANCMNDDIWLKASQIKNNIPVAFSSFYFRQFIEIPDSQKESLYSLNVFENGNDQQIIDVFDYFGITEKSFD